MVVEDDGMGIPPEELENIFDKFVQSSKTKSSSGGTSLGLAIRREKLNAYQGTIRATNRTQGGVLFEVRIPFYTRADSSSKGTANEIITG